MHTKRLSIVLPCFNEEESIDPVLMRLLQFKNEAIAEGWLKDLEIIVVNDGSTDSSPLRLLDYQVHARIIHFKKNRGYGAALKEGFRVATGDLLGFFDLDVTCDPFDIKPMIDSLSGTAAGMVCGNRLQETSRMPIQRRIGNLLYQRLTQTLLRHPVQDCCTGFRIFERRYRDLFCDILPDDLDFSLAMTISFLRLGGIYTELPISYGERVGQSKLKIFREGPKFLYTLLRYSSSRRFSRAQLQSHFADDLI